MSASDIGTRVLQWMVTVGLLLGIWYLAAGSGSQIFFAGPRATWDQIILWADDGTLWRETAATAITAGSGFLIGATLGVSIAALLGAADGLVRGVVEPWVIVLYTIPKFVFIPLLYLVIGNGLTPRVLFVSIGVFATLFVSTMSGLRSIDADVLRSMRLMGATGTQLATKVLVRYAIGYIAAGLSYATVFTFLLTLGGEVLFGGSNGLGGLASDAGTNFNAAGVIAATLVATVLGAALTFAARALSNRFDWADAKSATRTTTTTGAAA